MLSLSTLAAAQATTPTPILGITFGGDSYTLPISAAQIEAQADAAKKNKH